MNMTATAIKKIGYTLRFYRRIKDISQFEMADSLNISLRNYQRLEGGEIEPKLETICKISSCLNISLSTLFDTQSLKILNLEQVSSHNELKAFREIDILSDKSDHSLYFAKILIEKDKMIIPKNLPHQAFVKGDKADLSDSMLSLTGLKDGLIDINQFIAQGNCVDVWETVCRLNLRNPIFESSYVFPTGLKIFQEYHFNLKANPDNPTSECYLRDITDRHNLEQWLIQKMQRNKKNHLA